MQVRKSHLAGLIAAAAMLGGGAPAHAQGVWPQTECMSQPAGDGELEVCGPGANWQGSYDACAKYYWTNLSGDPSQMGKCVTGVGDNFNAAYNTVNDVYGRVAEEPVCTPPLLAGPVCA